MTALQRDQLIEQGATWIYSVGVLSDQVTTSWSVKGQIRPEQDSATVLYEWSTSAGNASLVEVDYDGDTIVACQITVPHAVSAAWTWRDGVYDVEIANPGNTVRERILQGRVRLSREVTR